jgi:hypothetical protein
MWGPDDDFRWAWLGSLMQHPYGAGLRIAPRELLPWSVWMVRRVLRAALHFLLRPFDALGLNRLRIMRVIWVKDRIGKEVIGYSVLHKAQVVDISQQRDADFLPACKHYSSGLLSLPESFVCEVSPALYYPELGLVANERFEVFGDSVLLPHRFHLSLAYRRLRPLRVVYKAGPISSIQRIDAYNFWHWMADCLPQLLTLERHMNGARLTLLASDELGKFQRETLSLMLPPNMNLEYVRARTWIKTDRFVLPSYLSGRCNGYLPEDFYAEIRRRIAGGLGIDASAPANLRIYLSRSTAKRRRVANEAAVTKCLSQFGFLEVKPEALSMPEQIDLFQRAEVIVGPHGAALGAIVFAPRAKVLVLYPERNPGEYFYTMARRLGIEHYGLLHDHVGEEDDVEDFEVNVAAMQSKLQGEMRLQKRIVLPA